MPGLQPENDGFDSHREHEDFSACSAVWQRTCLGRTIFEGSNPSTLTGADALIRVGGRMAMQRAVTPPSLLEIHGGSNPSLRIEAQSCYAGSSNGGTPASKSGKRKANPPRRQVRSLPGVHLDRPRDRAARCGIANPGTQVRFLSWSMWP